MPRPCPVCSLEAAIVSEVNRKLSIGIPVRDVLGWLQGEGYEVPYHSLAHHKRSHLGKKMTKPPETSTIAPKLSEMSSLEAQQWIILAALAQTDRLQQLATQENCLRIERLLSEHLQRVNDMLKDVSYE